MKTFLLIPIYMIIFLLVYSTCEFGGHGTNLKVADLYAQKASLAGESVSVSGKVVKVNRAILGRNWVHIQDGSGSKEDKNFNIVTTTNAEPPKVGDSVTATGVLALDRKWQMYSYEILVENSTYTVN